MALTIRLTEDEEKELARIQKHIGLATASGTIKALIASAFRLEEEIKDLRADLHGQSQRRLKAEKRLRQFVRIEEEKAGLLKTLLDEGYSSFE